MHRPILFTLIAAALPLAASAAPPVAAITPAFSPVITAASMKAYDKAISSDAMDGRAPSTEGAKRATAWIVAQMRAIGLQPGNDGAWFQKVPTVSTALVNGSAMKLDVAEGGATQTFNYGTDMVAVTLQAKPHVAIKDSPIVFVGYGVDAPQWHWNDYKGIDVKGKTVVLLVNDPGFGDNDPALFKGKTMTYYGRWTYKYEECARQGAAACFVVHQSDAAAGYPWSVVKNSWSGPQLALPVSEDPGPREAVAGWLTRAAAERLFAKAGLDFAKLAAAADHRGFKPVALKATAAITVNSKISHGSANNVIGLIRGSAHPEQVIVYSAHWDHLGENDKLKGDKIYNGAVDNGTGIAALLEIAKAFKAQSPAPKRSVLFLADTLEESGLLGSLYYTKHPVFPLDQTVADINIDMMVPIGLTKNVQIIGSGQNQLEDMLKAVLKQHGRYTIPDQDPSAGLYFRSDQFNFAKAGVPALYTQTGNDKIDGGVAAGTAALADFIAHRYHTPYDNFNPQWTFDGLAQNVEALYAVGRELADGNTWPEWYQDSAFRAKREAESKH